MRHITSFLLLGILSAGIANAQTVTLKQIGTETVMFTTTNVTWFNKYLYTLDNTKALYKTDLNTGEQTRLGKVTYKNTRYLFVVSGQLYCMEMDGSMNRIDINTGAWTVVSPIGSWNEIDRVLVVGRKFYTTQNGALFYHPTMNVKVKTKIGDDEFQDLGFYFKTDTTLHSLFEDGTLYNIDMTTGKWKRIGAKKGWKFAHAGAVIGNKFYSFEIPSSLFETDLTTGEKKELDKTQFRNTEIMFADSGKLYAMFKGGLLYEIVIN
jgi:hypothetical protein